ncbi:hypothetical protein [Paenibacillus massiliensis]|nr:hypothetical protein [Paenibacillus massiliensis]
MPWEVLTHFILSELPQSVHVSFKGMGVAAIRPASSPYPPNNDRNLIF